MMALTATAATADALPPAAVTDTLDTPFVSTEISPQENDTDPNGGEVLLIGCGKSIAMSPVTTVSFLNGNQRPRLAPRSVGLESIPRLELDNEGRRTTR